MGRRPHVELLRLVEERRHDIRALRAELETVAAVGLEPAHPGARLIRRGHGALPPSGTRPLVDDISGRGDLVLRAPLLLVHGVGEAREGNAAHRRYAVREPELVVVLGLRRFQRRPLMDVEVDDPWQDVHARGVDLARRALRPPRGIDRHRRPPDIADLGYALPPGDEADGTGRRTASAVDER